MLKEKYQAKLVQYMWYTHTYVSIYLYFTSDKSATEEMQKFGEYGMYEYQGSILQIK